MKIKEKMKWTISLLIITLAISSCFDTPIANYEPKNEDEREIISVLIQYQDAKNHFDIEKFLFFLHDKGQFSFQCGRMVSKNILKEELPGFWAEVKSGNPGIIPITHECVNGDYYKSGELNNPHIEVNNDSAKATVSFSKGVLRLLQHFTLLREDDQWLIIRTEWGHS